MRPAQWASAVCAVLCAALSCRGFAAAAADPTPPNPWWIGYVKAGKLVRLPDGRSLYLYCEGAGAPLVLMDSGLGDDASSWRKVQDQIAAKSKTRVCVYDRAGFGRSTGGVGRRDTEAEVDDIAHLMKAAKLRAPYVLVGHSMAGFNLRMFAYRRPADVAGMVLVDPAFEDQAATMDALLPSAAKILALKAGYYHACATRPEIAKHCSLGPRPDDVPADLVSQNAGVPPADYFVALDAEQQAFSRLDTQEMAAAKAPLGAIPLIVLTASNTWKAPDATPDQVAAAEKMWMQAHDAIAAQSTRGANRRVEGSGHSIQREKPQVVIDAVDEVIRQVRRRS